MFMYQAAKKSEEIDDYPKSGTPSTANKARSEEILLKKNLCSERCKYKD